MFTHFNPQRHSLAVVLTATAMLAGDALANTINQNAAWTINRSGATSTYRITAYGDSIFAGYHGDLFDVAKRSQPYVDGEYLSKAWNANIYVQRRCESGATSDQIYNDKIIGEASYMQTSDTRVVMMEMCGNDYLQARSNIQGQSGTCDFSVLDNALANCTTYMQKGMQAINQYATTAKAKIIMTIYYPGYDADNVSTTCTDATTGQPVNMQDEFLPYLAHSNWRACNLAAQNGFQCADAFAEMMGADYDSNGDGLVDSAALHYQAGETEADYVNRITVTLRPTLRDATSHFVNSSTSYDYLQSDNTHPTYWGSATVSLNWFTGNGSGSGASDFTDSQLVSGKNPVWNQYGHEKSAWAIEAFNPASP